MITLKLSVKLSGIFHMLQKYKKTDQHNQATEQTKKKQVLVTYDLQHSAVVSNIRLQAKPHHFQH